MPDAWIVALQLDELPEAYASEEAAIEHENDVLVVVEVGQGDVDVAVSDRETEVWRGLSAFGRRRPARNRDGREECCNERDW